MKKTVLFLILDQFADWEYAFLASALMGQILDRTSHYDVKTVSLRREPVRSIGGFTVLPDYSVDDLLPEDFAGLILIGGNSWRTPEAELAAPLLRRAAAQDKVVAAICDATSFAGRHGLLNGKKHTANTLESLIEGAGEGYSGQADYQNEQAVRDGNLITANGTAYLEFTREALGALEAYPQEYIESNYDFFRRGYVQIMAELPE